MQPILRIPRTGEQVPPPTTEAEALRLLEYDDALLTAIMTNLYRLYRGQGDEVLTAYSKTLEALVTPRQAP
jgi:hypothetical protein